MPKIGVIEVRMKDFTFERINKYYVPGLKHKKFAILSTKEIKDSDEDDMLEYRHHLGREYLAAATENQLEQAVTKILLDIEARGSEKMKIIIYEIETELKGWKEPKEYWDREDYKTSVSFNWEIIPVVKLGEKYYLDKKFNSKIVNTHTTITKKDHNFIPHTPENEAFMKEFEESLKFLVKKVRKYLGSSELLLASSKAKLKLLEKGK